MSFYDKNFKEYIENTKYCDMSTQYLFFEKHLKKNSETILDIGFGSCRDMIHFKEKGYDVFGIDPTKAFYDYALSLGFCNVFCMSVQQLELQNMFDGIWACASLIHVNKEELNDVFKKCSKALTKDGVIYCSFKYGDFSGVRSERYFIDLNEISIKKYLVGTDLYLNDFCITKDVRLDRLDDKWLNVILKQVTNYNNKNVNRQES